MLLLSAVALASCTKDITSTEQNSTPSGEMNMVEFTTSKPSESKMEVADLGLLGDYRFQYAWETADQVAVVYNPTSSSKATAIFSVKRNSTTSTGSVTFEGELPSDNTNDTTGDTAYNVGALYHSTVQSISSLSINSNSYAISLANQTQEGNGVFDPSLAIFFAPGYYDSELLADNLIGYGDDGGFLFEQVTAISEFIMTLPSNKSFAEDSVTITFSSDQFYTSRTLSFFGGEDATPLVSGGTTGDFKLTISGVKGLKTITAYLVLYPTYDMNVNFEQFSLEIITKDSSGDTVGYEYISDADGINPIKPGLVYSQEFMLDNKELVMGDTADMAISIDTYDELLKLQQLVNGTYEGEDEYPTFYYQAGKYYELGDDIVIPTGVEWVPIGLSSSTQFSGYFNGNGYTVSGMSITEYNRFIGLFGYFYGGSLCDITVEGEINVTVPDSYTTDGDFCVGGVAGFFNTKDLQSTLLTGNITSKVDITLNSLDYISANRTCVGGVAGQRAETVDDYQSFDSSAVYLYDAPNGIDAVMGLGYYSNSNRSTASAGVGGIFGVTSGTSDTANDGPTYKNDSSIKAEAVYDTRNSALSVSLHVGGLIGNMGGGGIKYATGFVTSGCEYVHGIMSPIYDSGAAARYVSVGGLVGYANANEAFISYTTTESLATTTDVILQFSDARYLASVAGGSDTNNAGPLVTAGYLPTYEITIGAFTGGKGAAGNYNLNRYANSGNALTRSNDLVYLYDDYSSGDVSYNSFLDEIPLCTDTTFGNNSQVYTHAGLVVTESRVLDASSLSITDTSAFFNGFLVDSMGSMTAIE